MSVFAKCPSSARHDLYQKRDSEDISQASISRSVAASTLPSSIVLSSQSMACSRVKALQMVSVNSFASHDPQRKPSYFARFMRNGNGAVEFEA
jgi:hypothetical protein